MARDSNTRTGESLRDWRKRHDLRGKDVAALLGYSPEHISRCETGVRRLSPTAWRLLRASVGEEALPAPRIPGKRAGP